MKLVISATHQQEKEKKSEWGTIFFLSYFLSGQVFDLFFGCLESILRKKIKSFIMQAWPGVALLHLNYTFPFFNYSLTNIFTASFKESLKQTFLNLFLLFK